MGEPVRLAVTCGDPAGVGAEVALRAAADKGLAERVRLFLVGPRSVWERAGKAVGIEAAGLHDAQVVPAGEEGECPFGKPTAESGRVSLSALDAALVLLARREADALVTGPISKEAIAAAGSPFRGHTDLLEARYPGKRAVMFFVGGGLRVGLVTVHIPLGEVPRRVTTKAVQETIRVVAAALPAFGPFAVEKPRIGVCGLNPHAGEGGLLGIEDEERIAPGIAAAKAEGIAASGPYAADTLFPRALEGEFDAIVAMYHDQGLAPVKARAFLEAANVTLGLPIVRTSPAHGTAWDRAGTGKADPRSMLEACALAALLATRRAPGSQGLSR
ncbi:MAG: 4-hydroxythreonine-4-phosphate dehydrogenase PdxA [Planctomycetales bacterium]|nr:4-hydroxythreonine-4-phosphate dehydrogenase PdxA [Planctomycetales bacterium]